MAWNITQPKKLTSVFHQAPTITQGFVQARQASGVTPGYWGHAAALQGGQHALQHTMVRCVQWGLYELASITEVDPKANLCRYLSNIAKTLHYPAAPICTMHLLARKCVCNLLMQRRSNWTSGSLQG